MRPVCRAHPFSRLTVDTQVGLPLLVLCLLTGGIFAGEECVCCPGLGPARPLPESVPGIEVELRLLQPQQSDLPSKDLTVRCRHRAATRWYHLSGITFVDSRPLWTMTIMSRLPRVMLWGRAQNVLCVISGGLEGCPWASGSEGARLSSCLREGALRLCHLEGGTRSPFAP